MNDENRTSVLAIYSWTTGGFCETLYLPTDEALRELQRLKKDPRYALASLDKDAWKNKQERR